MTTPIPFSPPPNAFSVETTPDSVNEAAKSMFPENAERLKGTH